MAYVNLQVAEKIYQDFTLRTKGQTGHSSAPLKDNSIYRLAAALDRLAKFEAPARLIPVTRAYFTQRAEIESAELKQAMLTLVRAKGPLPKKALATVSLNPVRGAYLRTTCVATMLAAGTKVNALPPEATANVNCRILPDETVAQTQARLREILHDDKVEVEPTKEFGSAGPSPTDGELPHAVSEITAEMFGAAPVIANMANGGTDSRFLRQRGVAAYGISGMFGTEEDNARAHGIDERIQVSSVRPGIEFTYRLIEKLAVVRATKL